MNQTRSWLDIYRAGIRPGIAANLMGCSVRTAKEQIATAAASQDRALRQIAADQCGLECEDLIVAPGASTGKRQKVAHRAVERLGGLDLVSRDELRMMGFALERTIMPSTKMSDAQGKECQCEDCRDEYRRSLRMAPPRIWDQAPAAAG